jgi:hypothetical protein
MNIEAINSMRLCSNARPPINHTIKYDEELEMSDQIAEFLAKGGEIEQVEGVGSKSVVYNAFADRA